MTDNYEREKRMYYEEIESLANARIAEQEEQAEMEKHQTVVDATQPRKTILFITQGQTRRLEALTEERLRKFQTAFDALVASTLGEDS
jgi:hypothetical protein